MKTTLLFIGIIALLPVAKAQTAKFFINGSAASVVTGDCNSLKLMKVSFPVPANVSAFDEYYINLNLSSLDVPAYIYFNKADIATYLKGKKEYVADLLMEDGTSDFSFDDNLLAMKDLCFNPRMWKMPEVKVEVVGVGYKITGYHYELVWNEQKEAYIETKIPDWDNGTLYGAGSINIRQQPLSEGLTDENEVIKIKPAGDKLSFGEPEAAEAIGTLSVTDETNGYPVEITFAYYDATLMPEEKIKAEILKVFTKGETSELYGAFMDAFTYTRELNLNNRINCNGKKMENFSKVTYGSYSYSQYTYRQDYAFVNNVYNYKLFPGSYINFMVTQIGKYVLVVNVRAEDVLAEDYKSVAFSQQPEEFIPEWFSTRINDAEINKVETMIKQLLETAVYDGNGE